MTGVAQRLAASDNGARDRRGRVLAYWLSPAGLVIGGATVLALLLRGFLLSRSHFPTSGGVEYDDGVYLGEAIRLLHGDLPYRDYALIQPPGIAVLMLPAAIVARLASTTDGLVLARVASVAASCAGVALAGNLVRHRGTRVTLVTCGLLASYPADIMAARTLLLEPWMNLCALLAATAAFRDGRLASPRRLAVAGLILGFAATIKFWAGVPAAILLIVGCLPPGRLSRLRWYLPGLAAGFVVPVAALAWAAPASFLRGTLLYQATRTGQPAPLGLRLDHLTGLIVVLGHHGIALARSSYSLFQADATASMEPTTTPAALPVALTVIGAALVLIPYLRAPRRRTHLEWFALGCAIGACAAILGYSAFFYHYPAFPAPWLAIAIGAAAGAIPVPAAPRLRAVAVAGAALACAAFLAVTTLVVVQLSGVAVGANPRVSRLVPPGACVLTDQVAMTIAVDRFTADPSSSPAPGCPDVVDALAQTLALSGGVSPQGGAGRDPRVIAGWEAIFGRAQYVWLSGGHANRIPWTPELNAWFNAHFHQVAVYRSYADSRLYQRNR
jgi:alpha-1,2-mannosyltransferase